MTVHAQQVEARRAAVPTPSQRMLAWLAIAAVLALVAIAIIVLFSVIEPTQSPEAVQKLSELRMSIGGGGFI
jgi:hypothetical protein